MIWISTGLVNRLGSPTHPSLQTNSDGRAGTQRATHVVESGEEGTGGGDAARVIVLGTLHCTGKCRMIHRRVFSYELLCCYSYRVEADSEGHQVSGKCLSLGCGRADIARPVIRRTLHPLLLSQMAPSDVASNICLALGLTSGAWPHNPAPPTSREPPR